MCAALWAWALFTRDRAADRNREVDNPRDVFTDTQIKVIKSPFSAGQFSGNASWLTLCEDLLSGQLAYAEKSLADLGVEYISQHELQQKELFHKKIDWPDAKLLAEATCLGLADAMIIKAFQCRRFPFIVSSDFDIRYTVLVSKEMKDVVMPDSVAKKYRDFQFDE